MTSSTGTVVFNDAKLQAIDVVATERLGVGTLDPASNLHVVGNVHVTGNVNKLNFTDGYTIKRGANVTVFGTTDVIQEITGPHARDVVPLRKYPEVAFAEGQFDRNDTTNTYTQGGYTVSTSDQNNSTTNAAYGAFDGVYDNYENRWRTDDRYVNNVSTATPSALNPSSPQTQLDTNTSIGEYLIIKLPSKIKLKNIVVNGPHMHMPYEVDIYGRNDVSTWTHVKNYVYAVPTGTSYVWNTTNQTIDATEYYLEYAFVVVKTNGHAGASIGELELYGYEETSDPDTSVDTKITSQFNLPDTTGVKLYIDGDKGSTPTDFSGEGHTLTDNSESLIPEKAWEFTSLSTSNVTMTTGDFAMEGTTHTPYPCGLTRRTCPRMRPSSTWGPRRVRATPRPPSHSRSPDTWGGSMVVITSSSRRTRGTISCTRRKGVVASARATSTVENWGTSPCKTRSGTTHRSR